MPRTLSYKVILEPSKDGGYSVYVPSLPGCVSEGDSYQEALDNIREAIQGWLEVAQKFGDDIRRGDLLPVGTGWAGRQAFRVWKFRTMVVDAVSKGLGVAGGEGDERITRVGRFLRDPSIDELPQILNVFVGEMGLGRPSRTRSSGTAQPRLPYSMTARVGA